jgi:hypothetical protein
MCGFQKHYPGTPQPLRGQDNPEGSEQEGNEVLESHISLTVAELRVLGVLRLG